MDMARRLKPHHLRLLVKISESGRLQFAAEVLGLSQPAASRVLAEMESSIGAPLFERTPKGMTPTPVGQAVLRHAQAILSGYADLETEVAGLQGGQMGEVRVGSVTGPAIRCLVPAILKIKQDAPLIEPTFEVGPSSELMARLEKGQFDFIIARLPNGYDSRAFTVLPARSEVVSLVVRAGHPLLARDRVSLADVARYQMALQVRGSPLRTALEEAFLAQGVQMPAQITNTSSLLIMLGLLEESDTVATMAEEVATLLTRGAGGAGLRELPLDRQIMVPPYFIIMERGKQLSRAGERLLDEVLARF